MRASLNAFLYRTGEQSDRLMLVLASNTPDTVRLGHHRPVREGGGGGLQHARTVSTGPSTTGERGAGGGSSTNPNSSTGPSTTGERGAGERGERGRGTSEGVVRVGY